MKQILLVARKTNGIRVFWSPLDISLLLSNSVDNTFVISAHSFLEASESLRSQYELILKIFVTNQNLNLAQKFVVFFLKTLSPVTLKIGNSDVFRIQNPLDLKDTSS